MVQGRHPKDFELDPEHVPILEKLVRDGRTPQKVAKRARMLLSRAAGERVGVVAARVEKGATTVWRLCESYRQRGLEALYDLPRSGRPPAFSPSAAHAHRESGLH